MDAAIAPWRIVFTGAVAGFFFVSSIVDSSCSFQLPAPYDGIEAIVPTLGQK